MNFTKLTAFCLCTAQQATQICMGILFFHIIQGTTTRDVRKPMSQTGPTTKAQYFWNAYGNLQSGIQSETGYDHNRELITYIQADPRYVSYVDEYLATATNLTEPREAIRARAVAAHQESSRILDTSPGYSTDMQGLANDFYFSIEQNYENTRSAPAIQPAAQPASETAVQVATAGGEDVQTTGTIPASPDRALEAVQVQPAAQPLDAEFTRTQLGSLAEPPAQRTEPVTTPIRAEDMPIQIPQEVLRAQQTTAQPAAESAIAAAPPVTADQRTTQDYTVARGDSLWKIAREHYGLESNRDIQRAVEAIAAANNMTQGTMANHIRTGQVIQLPDSPNNPQASLNWAALDADRGNGLGARFAAAAENTRPEQPQRQSVLNTQGPSLTLNG
jgi:nucleoid-associated protein YgaU